VTRSLGYVAYLVGSGIFLGLALHRESPWVATGSALFLVGTLLQLWPRSLGRDVSREFSREG